MQTDLEEKKREEEAESKHSLQSNLSKGDETDYFECQVAQIEIEEACPYVKEPSSPDADGNVETLKEKIKNLKVFNVSTSYSLLYRHYNNCSHRHYHHPTFLA